MVAANAIGQTVFQHLLRHLMTCQEADGCRFYMHSATNSVNCTFPSAEPESDVVCVCVRLVAQSVAYVNGSHLRWKLSTVGLRWV